MALRSFQLENGLISFTLETLGNRDRTDSSTPTGGLRDSGSFENPHFKFIKIILAIGLTPHLLELLLRDTSDGEPQSTDSRPFFISRRFLALIRIIRRVSSLNIVSRPAASPVLCRLTRFDKLYLFGEFLGHVLGYVLEGGNSPWENRQKRSNKFEFRPRSA